MSEGTTPADWVGERVRVRTNNGEEMSGVLEGVTEHGVVVNGSRGRGSDRGPTYFSWGVLEWIYPRDRQQSAER